MLAEGADREALTDVFVYLVAPEGYSHFVDTRGWSAEAYREWVLPRMIERGILAIDARGYVRVRDRHVLRYYARTIQHLLGPKTSH